MVFITQQIRDLLRHVGRLGLVHRVAGLDLLALDQPPEVHPQVAVVVRAVGRRGRLDDVDDEVVDVMRLDLVRLDVVPLLVEPLGPLDRCACS